MVKRVKQIEDLEENNIVFFSYWYSNNFPSVVSGAVQRVTSQNLFLVNNLIASEHQFKFKIGEIQSIYTVNKPKIDHYEPGSLAQAVNIKTGELAYVGFVSKDPKEMTLRSYSPYYVKSKSHDKFCISCQKTYRIDELVSAQEVAKYLVK